MLSSRGEEDIMVKNKLTAYILTSNPYSTHLVFSFLYKLK